MEIIVSLVSAALFIAIAWYVTELVLRQRRARKLAKQPLLGVVRPPKRDMESGDPK